MLLDKNVTMKWNSYNKKYYMNLGYLYTKMKDSFIINIKDLNKNSHFKIKVKCDNCNKIKIIEYRHYNNCIKNNNLYYCSNCRYHKIKITNMNKYNVENISYLNETKLKISKSNIKKIKISKIKREKQI